MQLTTPVETFVSDFKIDYSSKIMFAGSCFAENLSQYFINSKFNCLVNPSGIVYNPMSIKLMIDNVLDEKIYDVDDFFFDGFNFASYDFHGSFSNPELYLAISKANQSLREAHFFLSNCNVLFITLGTSYVYVLNSTNQVVSNCHKQPSTAFSRKFLSVENTTALLVTVVTRLRKFNPNLKIVFTVSPIRHLKDGLHANQISKASLMVSVNEITKMFPNCCSYFPSYEIVTDELRDYRFYAEDLVHVSPLAEKFIWERIRSTYFTTETDSKVSRVEKFMQAVHHKFQNPDSPQTEEFCRKNLSLAFSLETEIQGLDLTNEKNYFAKFIKVC